MRIVITGASGNLGSALVRRLGRDDHDLVGISRRAPATRRANIEWVTADLTEDSAVPVLREAFADADAVVHLAWGFQPTHDLAYLEEALGVGGTRRVLEAVTAASGLHLVHMSSLGAYSPRQGDLPVDESWAREGVPTSPYSQHKAAAERLLDSHEQADPDLTITRIRPGIIGQRTAGSSLLRYGVPAVVPSKVLDLLPVLPLDRGLAIPMVRADDVAEAVERVLVGRVGGAFQPRG